MTGRPSGPATVIGRKPAKRRKTPETPGPPPEPERLFELGNGLELWRVHVDKPREQDLNARAMPPAMFERLAETIGRDGRLESLPLLAETERGLEVVSGHHRLRAARMAGTPLVYALVDVTGLNRDQIAAKQLAHNAIAGVDEPDLLAAIFASIEDVDAQLEAYIDPTSIDLPEPDTASLPSVDLDFDYRTMQLVFLPHQRERFEAVVTSLLDGTHIDSELGLVDVDLWKWWQAVVNRTSREFDARSLSTVVSKIVDAAIAHYGIEAPEPDAVDPEDWQALSDVLGGALVPPEVGEKIARAVELARKRGEVGKKGWELVARWAEEYVDGGG
jgi:ParB-like nuclease domain